MMSAPGGSPGTGIPLRQIANQVLETAGSTNDCTRLLAEAGYSHGTWVSARTQTAGRGRAGHLWESRAGNLFLSMLLRIEARNLWSWVPLTAAVGAVSVLRNLFPMLDLRVKWPNDLWLCREGGFAKLGGILCESVTQAGPDGTGSYLIVGIGVNCAHFPENLDPPAVSLSAALGRDVLPEGIRSELVSGWLDGFHELVERGPASVAERYALWSALPQGTAIGWGTQPGGPRGRVQGLGPSGELLAVGAGGELVKLLSEDVRIRPA
jgi:BirA family transcriptional regulator, biotin operon repressor / biotin---[acetyl-CoA-carboxylase] ligase